MIFAINLITNKKTINQGRQIAFLVTWAIVVSIFLAMPEAVRNQGIIKEYYPSGLIGGWIASKLVLYLGKFGGLTTLILISLALLVATIRIEVADLFYVIRNKLYSIKYKTSDAYAALSEKREKRKELKINKKNETETDILIPPEPVSQPEINIPDIPVKSEFPETRI